MPNTEIHINVGNITGPTRTQVGVHKSTQTDQVNVLLVRCMYDDIHPFNIAVRIVFGSIENINDSHLSIQFNAIALHA